MPLSFSSPRRRVYWLTDKQRNELFLKNMSVEIEFRNIGDEEETKSGMNLGIIGYHSTL